jgi:hypothetical protein
MPPRGEPQHRFSVSAKKAGRALFTELVLANREDQAVREAFARHPDVEPSGPEIEVTIVRA